MLKMLLPRRLTVNHRKYKIEKRIKRKCRRHRAANVYTTYTQYTKLPLDTLTLNFVSLKNRMKGEPATFYLLVNFFYHYLPPNTVFIHRSQGHAEKDHLISINRFSVEFRSIIQTQLLTIHCICWESRAIDQSPVGV